MDALRLTAIVNPGCANGHPLEMVASWSGDMAWWQYKLKEYRFGDSVKYQ